MNPLIALEQLLAGRVLSSQDNTDLFRDAEELVGAFATDAQPAAGGQEEK